MKKLSNKMKKVLLQILGIGLVLLTLKFVTIINRKTKGVPQNLVCKPQFWRLTRVKKRTFLVSRICYAEMHLKLV